MSEPDFYGHEDLRRDRLWLVGRALASARDAAQQGANKKLGETSWSTGCRAYDFERFAVSALASTHDWLRVIDPGMQFLFTIGRVPIRFFHGEHEHPSPRHRIPGKLEEMTQQALLRGVIPSTYRLVIETGSDGFTTSVLLIDAATNGEILGKWCVWSPNSSAADLPEPADLPMPKVEPRENEEKEMEAGGGR